MADVVSNGSSTESDPFLHLHKMSTTAGLGSGDYVAINGTAIAAILLGVGSSMVLFNSLPLLAIPIAGVVCAVLAFGQISRSNGTQTGKVVAAVGLLLSLGFGGFYLTKFVYAAVNNRADRDQIVSVIHHLGDSVKNKDYASAYASLDARLQSHVPEPLFETVISRLAGSQLLGSIQSMDSNQLLSFDTDAVSGDQVANGMVKLMYANSAEPVRIPMSFRNINSKWFIDQIPVLFPEDAAPQQKKQQAPAAFGPLGPPKPQ